MRNKKRATGWQLGLQRCSNEQSEELEETSERLNVQNFLNLIRMMAKTVTNFIKLIRFQEFFQFKSKSIQALSSRHLFLDRLQ